MTGFAAKPVKPRTPDDNDWRYHAACFGHDGDLFFPTPDSRKLSNRDRIKISDAAGLCAVCPVTAQCAASRGDAYGVWAGEMHNLKLVSMPALHGDEAGYRAHVKNNEEPCPACLRGSGRYRAVKRKRAEPEEDQLLPSELFDWDTAIDRVKALLNRMYT